MVAAARRDGPQEAAKQLRQAIIRPASGGGLGGPQQRHNYGQLTATAAQAPAPSSAPEPGVDAGQGVPAELLSANLQTYLPSNLRYEHEQKEAYKKGTRAPYVDSIAYMLCARSLCDTLAATAAPELAEQYQTFSYSVLEKMRVFPHYACVLYDQAVRAKVSRGEATFVPLNLHTHEEATILLPALARQEHAPAKRSKYSGEYAAGSGDGRGGHRVVTYSKPQHKARHPRSAQAGSDSDVEVELCRRFQKNDCKHANCRYLHKCGVCSREYEDKSGCRNKTCPRGSANTAPKGKKKEE